MHDEPAHGYYTLTLQGRMVYCEYAHGFNLAGVRAITRDILSLTAGLDAWVLYQRPEPSAGIAQDAITEMMAGYVAFQNAGCLAVAIVDRSIFVRAGIPYHPEELTMPIKIDKDEQQLMDWLNECIKA